MSAEAPKNPKHFDLGAAIRILVSSRIKKEEDAENLQRVQEEKKRLEAAANTQSAAERFALIRAKNERGKEIIAASGARELVEQARVGLARLYLNATTAEEIGDSIFDTVYYGIYDGIPEATYQETLNRIHYGSLYLTPEQIRREYLVKQRMHEQRELYEHGKSLYKVRLAWSEYDRTKPIRNIMDRSKDSYDDSFSYIDVFGDGWTNRLIVREGLGYVGDKDRVFEEEEWRDPNKLAQAIFEAIKSPCRMDRSIDRSIHSSGPTYGSLEYYGKGESKGGG